MTYSLWAPCLLWRHDLDFTILETYFRFWYKLKAIRGQRYCLILFGFEYQAVDDSVTFGFRKEGFLVVMHVVMFVYKVLFSNIQRTDSSCFVRLFPWKFITIQYLNRKFLCRNGRLYEWACRRPDCYSRTVIAHSGCCRAAHVEVIACKNEFLSFIFIIHYDE